MEIGRWPDVVASVYLIRGGLSYRRRNPSPFYLLQQFYHRNGLYAA